MTSRFLQDIVRQRAEMPRIIDCLMGPGQDTMRQAVSVIGSAADLILTGIGASWNADLAAGSLFYWRGGAVHMQEAGELLHFAVVIVVPTKLDHGISVNTYSSLLIASGALASSTTTGFASIASQLSESVAEAGRSLYSWREQVEESNWLATGAPYYFLARGGRLGTCQEARLLWEEGVKVSATAMSTSAFRHGPQEIVGERVRFCMWIDQALMRDQDLSMAQDLRKLGGSLIVLGENLPHDAGDLVCQLPTSPPRWQFAIDVLPIQLAAERLSRMSGVNCDSFRVCSCVVEMSMACWDRKPTRLRVLTENASSRLLWMQSSLYQCPRTRADSLRKRTHA